jgi:hypothetical protein
VAKALLKHMRLSYADFTAVLAGQTIRPHTFILDEEEYEDAYDEDELLDAIDAGAADLFADEEY